MLLLNKQTLFQIVVCSSKTEESMLKGEVCQQFTSSGFRAQSPGLQMEKLNIVESKQHSVLGMLLGMPQL